MPEAPATLVLVHGAWHGPWCWQSLIPHLQERGISVQVPELPSVASPVAAGLAEDAHYLTALLKRISGPVVLCGHSYGGMVISAADLNTVEVRRLIYLCAYMTEAGESVDSSLRAAGERRPGHWIRRCADGRTRIDARRAAALFYNDCPDAVRSWAVAQLRPQWGQALSQICTVPAWRQYDSSYVVCSNDRVIAPGIQRAIYAARAQQVITLASDHSPFLSGPLQLAQALVSVMY
jgi:pimeloyl-ACP methyl ester carboxylesterase